MSDQPAKPDTSVPPSWRLKEVRYSLRDLLAEAAIEAETGAFGMEKLQQKDIGKFFSTQPRKRRATRD